MCFSWSRLNWWMRSTKIIKICSSSLCTCLHHMVILRTRNKITDFLMILAWASPFNPRSIQRCLKPHIKIIVIKRNALDQHLPSQNVGQHPSKHQTLSQCWINFVTPSATSAQHYLNIGSVKLINPFLSYIGQRLQRWPTILWCKGERQYLLTLQVSRYCLLPLQSSIVRTFKIWSAISTWLQDVLN